MTTPLSIDETSVNLRIDGSNEIISLRQAKWLILQVKDEHCTPDCLSCHFNKRYLRELEPEVIESLLANEFQVTSEDNQGGEVGVDIVNNRPVIIPAGIYWDVLALHKLPNDHLINYIQRVWKFRISELDISRIVEHFEDDLPTDGEGRPVYPDTIAPPRPAGRHLDSLPTTPVWRSSESETFPLLPIYSPRPNWNGVECRHPREVVAEPPTYASLGDAVQRPAYIGQVSTSNDDSIGSSVINLDNVRTEIETLISNSTPAVSLRCPEGSAAYRFDTEVLNSSYDAIRAVLDAREAESEKHEYNVTEHTVLPSHEEVIEWLHHPQLEIQGADVASLEAMVQQEIERMDQLVDQLFIEYGDDAFQNPRTPPAIPGRSSTLDFTPLPSPMLSAFPEPPASSDGHQWLDHMPPGTDLRGSNDSTTEYWAGDIGRLATIDDLEPQERRRWDEEARSSLQLSSRTLGNMVDWLSSRDHQEDGQGPPMSPITVALATEPVPPAFEYSSLSEREEVLIPHAETNPEPSSLIPDTLLPGSAAQPTEVDLEPVASRYSPTPSDAPFADYIDSADSQARRDAPRQHEQQEPQADPIEPTEYIAYQPANTPPRPSPVATALTQYASRSPRNPLTETPTVPLSSRRTSASYENGLIRARELLTVATWLESEIPENSLLSSRNIVTIDSLHFMVSELRGDLGFVFVDESSGRDDVEIGMDTGG